MSDIMTLVATLAQKYLAERPVIITGCGTSIPLGLPSMVDLATELLERVNLKEDPSWHQLLALLQIHDLEQSLQKVNLSEDALDQIIINTWNIIAQKDIFAYKNIIIHNHTLDLSRLFRHFLSTANPDLHVITTNYDRILEYASNLVDAHVVTGFTSGWINKFVSSYFDYIPYKHQKGYEGSITIHKVHGSLDWFIRAGDQPISIPLARDIPENFKPLIVTPGISKFREALKDPFRTILASSDAALKKARGFLCIGYGFNDEHVQPILVNRTLHDDIPIVIVTKELTTATKSTLLKSPPSKFLMFEECPQGTRVYHPNNPTGETISGASYWKLSEFLDLIIS